MLLLVGAGMAEEMPENRNGRVDAGHAHSSRWVVRQVDRLNTWLLDQVGEEAERESEFLRHFYGDRTSPFEVQGSHVRISPRLGWSESGGWDPSVSFSARLRLSRISRRLRFFAESVDQEADGVENIFSDRFRAPSDGRRNRSTVAGLTYLLSERTRSTASLSGGLRFRPEPVPQVRLRGRVHTEVGAWTPALIQTFFWDGRDGFGERSELDLPRRVGERHLFRAATAAEWSETTQGVEFGQVISWRTDLPGEREWLHRVGARVHTHPETVVDLIEWRIHHRRPAFRDWCFLRVEAGMDFREERAYRADPLVRLTLEFFVGEY